MVLNNLKSTKMIRKFLMVTLLLQALFINAQSDAPEETEDKGGFEYSGSVDVYFRANLNADYDYAPATSFGNLPGFSLGMANLNLGYSKGKTGVVADLVFGPRGEDATFLSNTLRPGGSSNIINQMYVYYNVSEAVTLTLGNFNTFLGYEVISPSGNFNYSTSYLFSYGPFSHTGLKADFALGENWSLMTGVFNQTDATEYNPINEFVFGAQLGYSKGETSVYLNTVTDADFYQVDLTAGQGFSNGMFFGLNTSYAKDAFWGVATYLQAPVSPSTKLGTRLEYFVDKGVGIESIGLDESVVDVSLTLEHTVGSLIIKPEVRADLFSIEGTVPSGDDASSSLLSFVLAAIYTY